MLSLSAMIIAVGLQAQKAEMDASISAFKSQNYSEAISEAKKAEQLLASNHTIEPKDLYEFYLSAAQSAKASGDMVQAAKYFAKLSQINNNPIYKARNKDTKNWEYFFDKAEADRITASGNYNSIREESFREEGFALLLTELNADANAALSKGNTAFQNQNYEVASNEFVKAYHLYEAVGNKNELLKYYAGIAMLQTDNKAEAAKMLQDLIEEGFTGVQTNYIATEKDSGKQVSFASKADMDTQVKLGLASNPKTETTESLEEELFSNTTYAWYSLENWDKALEVGKQGLAKFPQNENMNQLIAGVYFKTGNVNEFEKTLRDKIQSGNAAAIDYFNLAKTIEDNDGDLEEAKALYNQAIQIDPNFADAYLNLAYAIIKPEHEYVQLMNQNLGTSASEKKIYEENKAKRKDLYSEALPHLEKAYNLKPENINLIKVLQNAYEVVENDDKYFEFRKLFEEKSGR